MIRRLLVLICAAMALIPTQLMAQRSGGRGGRGAGGSGSGATRQSDSQEMKDLRRAMALQASPEQISQFKVLSKNTQQARSAVKSLQQLAAKTGRSYPGQEVLLRDAIENATTGTDEFVKSFSETQASGLKKNVHDLRKTDSDVDKRWTSLGQELRRSKVNDKKVATDAEHLDSELEKLQHGQSAVASEMSIAE